MLCAAHGLAGEGLVDTAELEQDASGLDVGDPPLGCTLTGTHTSLGVKVWIYKGDITEREFARQQAESGSRGRGRGERRGGRRGDRGERGSRQNTEQQQAAEQTPAAETAAADQGTEA